MPHARLHPYEAQLDALEGVLCADLIAGILGLPPVKSAADSAVVLERYRANLLEPIELPFIARAHRFAHGGRAKELIAADQALVGNHPEWLQLAPPSTRFGCDYLARMRPLRDERVVQRFLGAVRVGKAPGNHITVFGLTMAVFSIAPRQGLAEYAQAALEAVVATAAGKLKLTQDVRAELLERSQANLPEAISRMVA